MMNKKVAEVKFTIEAYKVACDMLRPTCRCKNKEDKMENSD